jgi:choline dehydrogenase-like flavoprotein
VTAPVDGAAFTRDVQEMADVVVVGSGAGGAVEARELAARGRDVVLVEEGGFWTGKDFTGNPRAMIDLLYAAAGSPAPSAGRRSRSRSGAASGAPPPSTPAPATVPPTSCSPTGASASGCGA